MDTEKKAGRPAFNGSVIQLAWQMPALARHQLLENVIFPVFFIVQKNLDNLIQLKIRKIGFKKEMLVLHTEAFPFLDPPVPQPARKRPGIGHMYIQKVYMSKGPVPCPGYGFSVLNWRAPWSLDFTCVHSSSLLYNRQFMPYILNSAPRYTSRTISFAKISSRPPRATIEPSAIINASVVISRVSRTL